MRTLFRRIFSPFSLVTSTDVFDVPGEMRRADRPVDHEFSESETLYRRISSDVLRPGMKIPIYALPLPDVSINRSKHGGKMEYVLYDVVHQKHLVKHGVVAFNAGDLVQPTSVRAGRKIQVRLSH